MCEKERGAFSVYVCEREEDKVWVGERERKVVCVCKRE